MNSGLRIQCGLHNEQDDEVESMTSQQQLERSDGIWGWILHHRINKRAESHFRMGIWSAMSLLMSFLLITGCAHQPQPPSPLPESVQQQLGRIGVVVRARGEDEPLRIPGAGRIGSIGRGASVGAVMGAGLGAQGAAGAYILAPFAIAGGLALGLVGGAAYGAVASEAWEEPSAAFRSVLEEVSLTKTLPERLADFSRMHGYEMTDLSRVLPSDPPQKFGYSAAVTDGIDTVLEIEDLTVNLAPAEFMVKPQRGLVLSAHAQLIRVVDGAIIDERIVADEQGPVLDLDSWMANHAGRFREEVVQASQRLAETVVSEYFILHRFPEQIALGSFQYNVHVKGLAPKQPAERMRDIPFCDKDIAEKYSSTGILDISSNPKFPPIPPEFLLLAERTDSYEPVLRWEPFPGARVTYEVKIWQAGRRGPEQVVYTRANIEQAFHQAEVTLKPSTLYYWSVRAHFSLNGKSRITEWSRRSVRYSPQVKLLTVGLAALFPDPVEERFYVFITPPSESVGHKPVVMPSDQKTVSCAWLHSEKDRNQSDEIPVVQSLQPTLEWDRFSGPGEDITYDLMVWRGKAGWREVLAEALVYEREGLSVPSHQIEGSLELTTHYLWAVRARYRLNGEVQMTNWSHEMGIGTSGQPYYCQFWTPASLPSAHAPAQSAGQS